MIHFSRWAMGDSSLIQQEEMKARIPNFQIGWRSHPHDFPVRRSIFAAGEESMIILVSDDRVLYELNLQDITGILATTGCSYKSYCRDYSFVSVDGLRIIRLYVRCPDWPVATAREGEEEQLLSQSSSKTHIELRISDLSGTTDQVGVVELGYSDPLLPDFHEHEFSFSPDLSMLQAGPHIFDLQAPGRPCLSFPDSSLIKSRDGSRPHVTFSECNGYLVVMEDQGDIAEDEPATFEVFRVCRTAGNIESIAIKGLDELKADAFLAGFHPWLPLLLLTCITWPKHDKNFTTEAVKVLEIDLEALNNVAIAIPKHGRLDADK